MDLYKSWRSSLTKLIAPVLSRLHWEETSCSEEAPQPYPLLFLLFAQFYMFYMLQHNTELRMPEELQKKNIDQ